MLKTIFLILTLVLSAHDACCTQTNDRPEDAFIHANTLYQRGEFSQAYDAYKTLIPKTNNIHFNMGNCAFKMGKNGYALLHWRQAENNWGLFGHEELHHNIALLKAQLMKNKENSGETTVSQTLTNMHQATKNILIPWVRAIPLLTLQLLVIIAWILLFTCIRFFRRRIPKTVIILFFSLFACAGATLAIKYNLNHNTYGIIVTDQAQLLSGPGDSFSLLGQLPEASEVAILKQSGAFYKIRHAGKFGWVDKKQVECF